MHVVPYVKRAVSLLSHPSLFLLNSLICQWMLLQVGSETPFYSPMVVKLSHSQTVVKASEAIPQLLDTTLHRE